MSTAVAASDSATADKAPHLVLESGFGSGGAGLRLGRQDERHEDEIEVKAVEVVGIVWLADEDIQFGEVPSSYLGSLYPLSVSIFHPTTAVIAFHPHQETFIYQATPLFLSVVLKHQPWTLGS